MLQREPLETSGCRRAHGSCSYRGQLDRDRESERDDIVLTLYEKMKSTVWLLAKRTMKASGLFEADGIRPSVLTKVKLNQLNLPLV